MLLRGGTIKNYLVGNPQSKRAKVFEFLTAFPPKSLLK